MTGDDNLQRMKTLAADTSDLYSQAKQAHWNVKEAQFHQLHELFDKLADHVEDFSDVIAERVTALGGSAPGTVRMSASASRWPEYAIDGSGSMATVQMLVMRFAQLAGSTQTAIDAAATAGDVDTADLFTEVSRGLDKSLWFLEAYLLESGDDEVQMRPKRCSTKTDCFSASDAPSSLPDANDDSFTE